MDIAKQLKQELNIELWQVEAVIQLIDEGNTIPFIARYRKEKHGSLDDEQLRNLSERLTYLRNLEKRKEEVIRLIAAEKITVLPITIAALNLLSGRQVVKSIIRLAAPV